MVCNKPWQKKDSREAWVYIPVIFLEQNNPKPNPKTDVYFALAPVSDYARETEQTSNRPATDEQTDQTNNPFFSSLRFVPPRTEIPDQIVSCPEIGLHKIKCKMNLREELVRRTYYSQELKHQICKDHIENHLSLRECVDKYNLGCHSLVHDWLRKLGYVVGHDRRSRSALSGASVPLQRLTCVYFFCRIVSGLELQMFNFY